jgi:NAD dependent epimerase/dehydratase family enzyme
MPWIDRDDVIRFIEWAIDREEARGVYNVAAPAPVTNRDFTKALAAALHRPAIFPLPAFVVRAVFGEMADETLLTSERAVPARAMAEGFTFAYGDVARSLRHALAR